MLKKLARLFVIKTRFEAFAVIYAIAVGAVSRGYQYMDLYPGPIGYAFFAACTGVVFIAGAKILDATAARRKPGEERRGQDRRAQPYPNH
ncbi:hypothetical protein [Allosphingosinicella sp.]|uniref:hypothetical protein n=1 Tax=Allosphingosinicella sp. TaxID=2823234 RepID=UPI002FC101DE